MTQEYSMFFRQDPAQPRARFLMLMFVLMLTAVTGLHSACADTIYTEEIDENYPSEKDKLPLNGDTVIRFIADRPLTITQKLSCADTANDCSITIEGKGTMNLKKGLQSGSLTVGEGITLQVEDGGIEVINKFTNNGGTVSSVNTAANGKAVSAGSVEINGGQVTARGNQYGIHSDGSINISDGANVTAAVTGTDAGNAIYAFSNVNISGDSVVTIESTTNRLARGISADTFTISGGKLTAKTETGNHGLLGAKEVKITDNAEVEITGYEFGIGTMLSGSVTISSGKVTVETDRDAINADNVSISGGQVTASSTKGNGIASGNGKISLSWTDKKDFIYASSYSGTTETQKRFVKYSGKPDAGGTPAGIVPAGSIADTAAIAGFTLRPLKGFCVRAYDGVQVRDAAVTIDDTDHKTYCEYASKETIRLIRPDSTDEKWKKISAAAAAEPAKPLSIVPKDLSVSMPEDDLIVRIADAAVSIDPIDPEDYTGSGIEPGVTVKDGGTEQVLSENTDYAVTYEDNINAGKNSASAIVSGKGIYFGQETVKFTIKPKAATVTAIDQTINEGGRISTGTDQAVLSGAAAGHVLSAVTLTPNETAGTITPSDAKITEGTGSAASGKAAADAEGSAEGTARDVTNNYSITPVSGKLTVRAAISHQVTFTVKNGSWNNGTDEDIIVTLSGFEGDELKLSADQIPAAGNNPAEGYTAGSWDPVPDTVTAVTEDMIFTYTYEESEPEPEPEPDPDPEPEPNPEPGMNFFRIWAGCELPATGFSALRHTILPEQPKDLRYEPLRMRIQIPSLNVETELVTIPRRENSWEVRWLDDAAGLLEGSALPGEGYAVLAGHNTLNDSEYGPFALLGTLKSNDLITVNAADESMQLFRVYANESVEPDGLAAIEAIARQETGSLVLLTCENEGLNGEYLDRRAVFAKPVK